MSTKYRMGETSYGDVEIVRDIYEADGHTWQRFEPEFGPANIDNFVRPTYTTKNDERDPTTGIKTGRQFDRQHVGFDTLCFEAWVKTSHAVALMLYKRTLTDWNTALKTWSQGAYLSADARYYTETVGSNKWHVYRLPLKPRVGTRIAGAFELRLLPLGDTGYTLALELAANEDSLRDPEDHAKFQAMFRHLIESVKIERLTPAIEAEIEQLKTKANAVQAEDCRKSKNPPSWCARNIIR